MANKIKARMDELHSFGADMSKVIPEIMEIATQEAVNAATELTPPDSSSRVPGTNTISGELKAAWQRDSTTKPVQAGNEYRTVQANQKLYASFVNDGHVMDEHFVPGLVVNPHSGLLELSPDGEGGIVVGTQTEYVPGIYMREAGLAAYEHTLVKLLDEKLEKVRK